MVTVVRTVLISVTIGYDIVVDSTCNHWTYSEQVIYGFF